MGSFEDAPPQPDSAIERLTSSSAVELFADVENSVVEVRKLPLPGTTDRRGGGTGFFVSSGEPHSCEVATVNHVTESEEPMGVTTHSGEHYKAVIELIDLPHEIAIYKLLDVKDPQKTCLEAQLETKPPEPDEKVLGIGASKDPTKPEPYEGVTYGIVKRDSSIVGDRLDIDVLDGEDVSRDLIAFYPMDADHGDSGGPIFNYKRKVVALQAAANEEFSITEMSKFLQQDLNIIRDRGQIKHR